MIFISFLISSCASIFFPVQAAFQAAVKEVSIPDQLDTDAESGLTIPQEPVCSGNNMASCSNMGTSAVSITSHSEALRDIAKEMSSGQDQLDSGVYAAAAFHYIHARELAKGLEDTRQLAEASKNLATVWLLQGKLSDALDELLMTAAVTNTSSLLHVLGNVHREMGHMSRALELYEEARGLEWNPQALIDMGEVRTRLGSFDMASNHAEEVLKKSEPNSLDEASAHGLDGFIRLSRGDASGSLQRLNSALKIQTNALRPGHHKLVLTHLHRSRALRDTGSLDTAIAAVESLEQTLRHLTHLTSENLQLSRVLTQKADFLHQQGLLEDAKQTIEEVFVLQTEIFKQQASPEVASAMNIYASILHDMNNLTHAQFHYEQSLSMNRQTVGNLHPETASVHNSLGTLLQDKGNLHKAGYHFTSCLDIQLKTIGKANPEVASTYNNLGTVAFQKGEVADAEEYFEQALSLLDEAQVPEESPDRMAYRENLSELRKMRAE